MAAGRLHQWVSDDFLEDYSPLPPRTTASENCRDRIRETAYEKAQ